MTTPKPGPPPERLIVYVDGYNLYHGLKDRSGRSQLWIDLVQLGQSIRPRQQLVKVRYFTAPVLDDPPAQARQDHYIDALGTKYPGMFEVHLGRYQKKDHTCRSCGHTYPRYEEKETDVNIATQLVVDVALRRMDSAILISADSDLAPAVRAAKQLNPNMFAMCAFPPKRFSNELKTLMPVSIQLGRDKLKLQLPNSFSAGGKSFTRPERWQ